VELDDDLLASVPGVSQAISKSLLAELPQLGTFDRRSMAALAGLAPFTRQSGPLVTEGGAAMPSSPRA
jgi:transposase